MGLIVYGGDSPTVKLQEVKIRKDNDFKLMFLVERNGNPEDMEQASIVSLKLISPKAVETLLTPALIKENVIYLDIESTFNTDLGKYRLEMKYTVLDPEFTGGVRDCAVDTYAYTIVASSSEATKIDELAKSVDVATGFQGKAFTFDMYTQEQIELLQSPALEAAQAALSATQSAESAATAAIQAKNDANTAAQGANTATGHANAAATNANTEAGKATEAATSANSAASDAYQKAIVARQEAEKAERAATQADQARVALAQSFQVELEYAEQKLLEVDQAKAAALGAANTANAAASDATTKGNLAESKAEIAKDAAINADSARTLLVQAADLKMGEMNQVILAANYAVSDAETATARANASAETADDAAALANTKAGLANDAAGSANTAATTANTAAGLADTARTELTTAVNTKLGEADGKIEEMNTTLSTYDGRVTQVESDIDQLAGEVSVKIENLAVNGDFSNGLLDWDIRNCTGEVVGGILTATCTDATDTMSVRSASQRFATHIYYGRVMVSVPQFINGSGIVIGAHGLVHHITPTNGFEIVSGVYIGGSDSVSILRWQGEGEVGDIVRIKHMIALNLTQIFGAGNEPTKEEMDLLISTLGIDYFEGEITVPAQKIMQWQLKLIRKNKNAIIALEGTII